MQPLKYFNLEKIICCILIILFSVDFSYAKGNDKNKKENDVKDVKIKVTHHSEDCSLKAKTGDEVFVHYTGRFLNGEIFDSSIIKKTEPISFVIGARSVIPGLESGLIDMCVGEKREITIPHELAYGVQGKPPHIPGRSTLIFETELVSINRPSASQFNVYNSITIWSIPLAVGAFCFYLYQRYQQETTTSKNRKPLPAKSAKRSKKSR